MTVGAINISPLTGFTLNEMTINDYLMTINDNSASLTHPHPRVEQAVGDVGEDVDDDEDEGDEQQGAHDDGEVVFA